MHSQVIVNQKKVYNKFLNDCFQQLIKKLWQLKKKKKKKIKNIVIKFSFNFLNFKQTFQLIVIAMLLRDLLDRKLLP